MIKCILWDVDGTLLNFKASEKKALSKCLDYFKIPYTDETISLYSQINLSFWKRLEKGEITREEVLLGRFEVFFEKIGVTIEPNAFQKKYQYALANVFFYQDDSLTLCKKLKEKGIKQYIVTNGVASTQHKKLRDSKFFDIIDGLFISDEIGSPKPSNAFFDAVFENIPPFKKDEIIIIGDSLTSDIKGGNNAEILCCWYNIANEKNTDNLKIDYEIKNLWEILKILELD